MGSIQWSDIQMVLYSRHLLGFRVRYTINVKQNFDSTSAQVEGLPGEAIRLTPRIASPFLFHPRRHIFLYVPSIGFWASHSLPVAWSQEEHSVALHGRGRARERTMTTSLLSCGQRSVTDKLEEGRQVDIERMQRNISGRKPHGRQSVT